MKMKRWIMVCLSLAAAGTVRAAQLNDPDPNTMWMEDGTEIETSEKTGLKHWLVKQDGKNLEIKAGEDGKGFRLIAPGKGCKTSTRVKLNPDYPYLVLRVADFEIFPGYCSWTVGTTGRCPMSIGQVKSLQKGIFVFDLFQNLPEETDPKKGGTINLWLNNIRLDLGYIKLVKKPDYVVRAECSGPELKPGSKVKFTAELAEEAEDVSITLVSAGVPRAIKVNGGVKIQLKPVDNTLKIWAAEIEIEKLELKKPLKRFKSFMRMDVLGGALDEPVWVGLPYPVEP